MLFIYHKSVRKVQREWCCKIVVNILGSWLMSCTAQLRVVMAVKLQRSRLLAPSWTDVVQNLVVTELPLLSLRVTV